MQTSGRKAFRRHAIACVYDADNRRTEMVDGSGTTTWTYNSANAITALSTPQGNYSYTYNDALQRVTMVESSLSTPNTTSYAYSGTTGLLTQIENRFSEETDFEYDSHGRVEKKIFDPGHYEQTVYDVRGRVSSITVKDAFNNQMRTQSYAYDAANFVTGHTVGTDTTEYTYDNAGQLIREEKPWANYDRQYEYDGNGNRTKHIDLGGVESRYIYAPGDVLTQIEMYLGGNWTPVRTFGYDSDKRMTSDSQGSKTFSWDAEGRLTTLVANSVTSTHAYNGMNTRVSRTVGGTTNTFTRDGVDVTAPLMRETSGLAYTPSVSYRSGSSTTFQHFGLKNTQWETDSVPVVQGSSEFDAFGNEVGTVSLGSSPFGYGGGHGYQTDGSGLQLLGHRWYDPTLGRFLTRDPIKDGRNWYTYCANEPVGNVDPEGESTVSILKMAAGAALCDGPSPIGDVVAVGLVLVAGGFAIASLINRPHYVPAHDRNARPSTRDPHQGGEAREQRDRQNAQLRRKKEKKPKGPPTQPDKNSPEYLRKGPKRKTEFMPGDYDPEGKMWH